MAKKSNDDTGKGNQKPADRDDTKVIIGKDGFKRSRQDVTPVVDTHPPPPPPEDKKGK